jgi:hypothetical protein
MCVVSFATWAKQPSSLLDKLAGERLALAVLDRPISFASTQSQPYGQVIRTPVEKALAMAAVLAQISNFSGDALRAARCSGSSD